MPTQKIIDPYKEVSNIYPKLMGFVNYKWWARYIHFITRKQLKNKPDVLEIAAGNCTLAKYLIKYYKNYVASDISHSMLLNSKLNINRVCCDMTLLPFKKKFDLIFSSFDSVNYLMSKKKLTCFFSAVSKLLNDDGILTFDAALENNSYKHQRLSDKKGSINGFSYTRESVYMPASKIHKNIFNIKSPDGKLVTEIHRQKIFSYNTFFELAEKSDLYVVNCYKAFSMQRGKEKSDRVQFVMKRKK